MSSGPEPSIMTSQIRRGAITIAILLVCLTSATSTNDGQTFSVRVVGSVFCDTCHRQEFHKTSYFIKGAPVAVECETGKERPNFRIEANTNEHGQFEVELPVSETQLKKCSATLMQREGPCRVLSMANSSSFTLKSKKGGMQTYSAGFFTYRPQTVPPSCSNEVADPKSMSNQIAVSKASEFESSKQTQLPPFLSPFFPSPSPPPPPPLSLIPGIPSLPPFMFPPIPFLTPSPPPPLFNLPPLPFLQPPPPSLIPPIGNLPNPFQPSPPSLIPPVGNLPNPLQPPPSLIPPIGNLPNPFQPPSGFPFPFPPVTGLPFPPFIPPAQHTLKDHSTQP